MRAICRSLLIMPVVLAGCATTAREQPILTKAVTERALKACHASAGGFHPSKKGLPWVSVKSRAGEVEAYPDQPTPTTRCLYEALKTYRYDYTAIEDVGSTDDQ